MTQPLATIESRDRGLDLAAALMWRAAGFVGAAVEQFDRQRDVLDQLDNDYFESPLTVCGMALDSLAVVELLDSIETDLDVWLFDVNDVEEIATLRSLSALIVRLASPARVDEFLRTCYGPPVDT